MSIEYAGGANRLGGSYFEDRNIRSVYVHRGGSWDGAAARYYIESRAQAPTRPTVRTSGAAAVAWLAEHPADTRGRLDWLRRHQ